MLYLRTDRPTQRLFAVPVFSLRRSLTVFALVFAVLFIVSLLKGRGVGGGLEFAALWSVISTTVFAAAQAFQARRGAACEICEGEPAEPGVVAGKQSVE